MSKKSKKIQEDAGEVFARHCALVNLDPEHLGTCFIENGNRATVSGLMICGVTGEIFVLVKMGDVFKAKEPSEVILSLKKAGFETKSFDAKYAHQESFSA